MTRRPFTSKLVDIRRYQKSIGRSCMRCNRSATIKAVRVDRHSDGRKFRLNVRYCEACGKEAGA